MTSPRTGRHDRAVTPGAGAGAAAAVLFVVAAVLVGERPGFHAPGVEVVAHLDARRTEVQLASALFAVAAALLVWFLSTVTALARAASPGARPATTTAYGCGLVFVALFLADITALAVGALRPGQLAATPQLAVALRDFELLAMGVAAPVVVGMLAALAWMVIRHGLLWPVWIGWLAAGAALAYSLRAGTLFVTDGPFAADGVLGLLVPVGGLVGWLLLSSVTLTLRPARRAPAAADRYGIATDPGVAERPRR